MVAGGANKGGGHGRRGGHNRARSVGASAGGSPNGAILNDNDAELQRKERMAAWKRGRRGESLPENAFAKMYKESPHPVKGGS